MLKKIIKVLVKYIHKIPLRLTFRKKITLSIFLFSTLPLLIFGSFYFSRVWDNKINLVKSTYAKQLSNCVRNADSLILYNLQKLYFINYNPQIFSYISSSYNKNLVNAINASENVKAIFDALEATDSDNIFIYVLNDSIYETKNIIRSETFDNNLKNEILNSPPNSIVFKKRQLQNPSTSIKEDYICLYRFISSINNSPLAIIELRIPMKSVLNIFNVDVPKNSFIVLTDSNDFVKPVYYDGISPDDAVKIFQHKQMKNKFQLIKTENIQSTPYQALMYISTSYVSSELNSFVIQILLSTTLLACIIFFSVKFTSSRLTSHLTTLVNEINMNVEMFIHSKNPSFYYGKDEEFNIIHGKFHELVTKINEYHQKSQDYFKQIMEYQLETKTLQLKVLQERINPHFLYNTLSAIKWAYPGDSLSSIIDSMVRYYRIALSKGDDVIPLNREFEMLKEYLEIQKFAYDSNFIYTICVDEAISKTLIPKQLLQPIVENAVLHGIKRMTSDGMISISATVEDNYIILTIKDNGRGMEPEKITQLLKGEKISEYSGYGMKNVLERLQLAYGSNYNLNIDSTLNAGTSVTLRIPTFIDLLPPHS